MKERFNLELKIEKKGVRKMDMQLAKEQIRKSEAAMISITNKAWDEGRGCTREEETLLSQLEGAIDALKMELPERALILQNGPMGSSHSYGVGNGGLYALRGPNEAKNYKALFGSDGYHWQDKNTNFFSAVFSGCHHEGFIKASMTE